MPYTSAAPVGIGLEETTGRSLKARLAGIQHRMPRRNYLIAAAAVAVGTGLAALRWHHIRREANLEHGLMFQGSMLAEVACD